MNIDVSDSKRPSDAIYKSFVLSVFSDYRLLLIGVPTSVLAILLTAFTTGSAMLYAIAAAVALCGGVRYLITDAFHKRLNLIGEDRIDYRKWETRYTVSAVVYCFLFGLWCFVSAITHNQLAIFASVTVTFANLIGVCGRCFPISRLVNAQIVVVSIPLVSGLVYYGGVYSVLALMLAPYLVGLRSIAARQRDNLLNNVVHRHKAENYATQFHTALENVPHGICMFDAQGRLEVANQHIGAVIDRSINTLKRMTMLQLVELLHANYGLPETRAHELKEWILRASKVPISFSFELGDTNKRSIKFRASRIKNGGVIATFEDVTRETRAASQIDHMVRFDRLTGLMNRNQLPPHITQELLELKEDEKCAVVLVNVDRFKQVNDTMGHRLGDLLLSQIANRLNELVDGIGVCARYGGDEFAIILRQSDCLDLAVNIADCISESFQTTYEVEGRAIRLDCSIGIALSEGRSETAENILRHADLALLWAKKDGRGEWRVYNSEMSRELQTRRKLENDLRIALTNEQFEAHFQPIVNLKDNQVSVCEALLRWHHPQHGFVSPATFVPIAEELGLISDIGSWMLFEACQACASWPDQTRVAVNLSPLQFKSGGLAKTVEDALASSGLDPSRLELEITESLMLEDIGETVELLNQFKRMGVRISLDDFGTGYSSLNYMNELPLDKVKIDRSFVMDLEKNSKSLTLVEAITALGHKLGLSVVVEGIETVDQLKLLTSNAPVDEIQGFLFSKPVSAAQILKLLDRTDLGNRSMLLPLKDCEKTAA